MKSVDIKPIKELGIVDRSKEYVVVRLTGLFGDLIHASSRFDHILKTYPNLPWIVIHSYPVPKYAKERIQLAADNLMIDWVKNGRIEHYFYDTTGLPGAQAEKIPIIMNAIRYCRCQRNKWFDCYVDVPKVPDMIIPNLGIDIPVKKDPKKAIILRYSAWHKHFLLRNRPYSDWLVIERKLIELGYDVTIIGHDDPYPNINKLNDLRQKLTIREVLEYSKDASLCITPATFLYVWTQFVCPTIVLSDPGDVINLNKNWKLNDNMMVVNVSNKNYLSDVIDKITIS